MLKSNVLVRKMVGIETAGNINILFTDKTGTITNGKLSVQKLINFKGNVVNNNKYRKIFIESLLLSKPLRLSAGIIIFLNPSLSASNRRSPPRLRRRYWQAYPCPARRWSA